MQLISTRLSLIAFIAIFFFNVLALFLTKMNLYADEAQYWFWSLHPEFGYYSKPPIIAWLIGLTTKFLGHSEAAIRLFSPILYSLTAVVLYQIGLKLFDKKIAVYSALIFLLYPAITVATQLISTDAPLLFFWTLSLLLFLRLRDNINTHNIVMLGISIGLGMMSKYNMGLWGGSLLLYLFLRADFKRLFWPLLASALIALIVFSPNILWNYNNHFASFMHTADIAKLERSYLYPNKFLEFLIGQILIIGPIFSVVLIKNIKNISLSDNNKLLFSFALLPIGLISILSLISGANINWAAPGFITISLLLAQQLVRLSKSSQRNILIISGILFIFIKSVFLFNIVTIPGVNRVYGTREIGKEFSAIHKQSNLPIIFDDRKFMAWSLYYSTIPHSQLFKFNQGPIKDHFDLTKRLERNFKGKALFISREGNLNSHTNFGNMIIKHSLSSLSNQFNAKQRYFIYEAVYQ